MTAVDVEVAGRVVNRRQPGQGHVPASRGSPSSTWSTTTGASSMPLMTAIRGRPVLMQRFPSGVDGSNFFQKRVPKDRPDWLETSVVSTPNGTTSQALVAADLAHIVWAVNLGCLGFHVWPNVAARRRPRRRAAHRPRPAARSRVRRGARRGARAEGAARRGGHPRVAQDHRQPRHPRLHAPRAALDADRGATRSRRGRARARPPPSRRDHRRVVEGRARRPRVRRLQPERAAQDGVRRVVDPGAAGGRGLDAVRLGRARRHRSRGVHGAHRARSGRVTRAIRGPTSPTTRRSSRRCSRCTTATSSPGSRTRRGRPCTRRCPANRRGSRRAGPARTTTAIRSPRRRRRSARRGHAVPKRGV